MASNLGSATRPASIPSIDYTNGTVSGANGKYVPEAKIYQNFTICGGINRTPIGRIQEFQPGSMSRDVMQKYELGLNTWGIPVNNIPGKASGFTLSVTRLEIWGNEFESAFGISGDLMASLMDQKWGIELYELQYKGQDLYAGWKYVDCWLTSLAGVSYSAEGDNMMTGQGEFTYLYRTPITGSRSTVSI